MDYYEFMDEAICEAKKSEALGDVPVGAVAVYQDRIIGRGYNRKEIENDPSGHAEIIALRNAATYMKNWRLHGVTLFVTMEPCPMCAGAILQARIQTLVFGVWDINWGACGSKINILENNRFNHNLEIIGGIRERECAALVQNFFQKQRKEPL